MKYRDAACCLSLLLALGSQAAVAAEPASAAVARSNILIGQANILPAQAMPLGNGRLGAAVWAANGLTLQLNRIDTLPYRRSPGAGQHAGPQVRSADK